MCGGTCYALFIAQMIYPNNILLYGASVLLGMGDVMWVAAAHFLTLNCDEGTRKRNAGIFSMMRRISIVIGNTIIYFQFQGQEDIGKGLRMTVGLHLSLIHI